MAPGGLLGLALRASLIVGAGAGAGFVLNAVRGSPVTLQRYQPVVACSAPAPADAVEVLSVTEAAAFCGGRGVVIADTRSASAFAVGHIAGAVHLPCSARAKDASFVIDALGSNDTLLVYGESTADALEVARNVAARANHRELSVAVVDGGFDAWSGAGLACASGACEECNEVVDVFTHP